MILSLLLSAIGLGLMGIQLFLWKQMSFDQLRFGALGCIMLGFLIWERRGKLTFESQPLATLAGSLLVVFFVVKSASSPGAIFASFGPAFWGAGLAILASGFGGLKQYRREALIAVLLILPFFLRWFLFDAMGLDITPVTARAVTALVHMLGYEASLRGNVIVVPTGSVSVYEACSGLKAMFLLFGLAVLLLILFPPPGWLWKITTLFAAVGTAFLVNAARVALLVIFLSSSNTRAFHYWHTDGGALLFEVASVMAFALLYRFVIMREGSRTHIAQGGEA